MNILFAASENAWGGFLGMIRSALPRHHFEATGGFEINHIEGFDVLIPTMCPVTEELLEKADRLRLIQQCGSGLEGVDFQGRQCSYQCFRKCGFCRGTGYLYDDRAFKGYSGHGQKPEKSENG